MISQKLIKNALLGNKYAIMPGEICKSCIRLFPADGISPCPWGNSKYPYKTTLYVGEDGTPGSLCHEYKTYEDIGVESQKKTTLKVESMTDSQLNVEIYRKIQALKTKDMEKLFGYWHYLFPDDYAKDMVTDSNESEQRKPKTKPKEKKFEDRFKIKNKGVKK